MIKIEIKDSVKIIENRNKIHYCVSGIEILNFYFNFIEFFLSLYPIPVNRSLTIVVSKIFILKVVKTYYFKINYIRYYYIT